MTTPGPSCTSCTTEAEALPTSLGSFKHFQTRLKENLEVPPKVETFALVQSAMPMF
jgi:hypothetical protein